MTVDIQQLNGADPRIDRLTLEAIPSAEFPDLDRGLEDEIRALLTVELAEKIKPVETIKNQATAGVSGLSAAK